MSEKEKTIRVQIDFSPEAIQQIEEIGESAGSTTRSETIRNALRLYSWFIEETTTKTTIQLVDDGEVTTSFRASLLHDGLRQKERRRKHLQKENA